MPGTHHPQSVLGQPTVLPAVIGKSRKFAFLGSNKKGGTVESQKGCLLDSAEQLSNLKPCLKQVKTWLTSTFYLAMAMAGSTFRFGIFGSCRKLETKFLRTNMTNCPRGIPHIFHLSLDWLKP